MVNDQEILTEDSPRKLTIEEVYQDLFRSWKKALVRIGQLKSEIDELRYEKERLEKQLSVIKEADNETMQELRKEQLYEQMKDKNKILEKRVSELKKNNDYLITKLNQNG